MEKSTFPVGGGCKNGEKEKRKGMIWEAAPDLNLRPGWRIEGLFTRVFNGGGLETVDKSGLFGPRTLNARVKNIN